MALDVLDPQAVMHALTEELDPLAGRFGWGAIRAMVLGEGLPAEAGPRAAGLRRQGATPWKRLPPGAPATRRGRSR